ncbi:hypothetical protein BH23VER1_BH23VER1_08060 [soil metagenome]
MWVFLKSGFFSITRASVPGAPGDLQVRARCRADLERLIPGADIVETVDGQADYPFRVVLGPAAVAELVSGAVTDIDYGNFKSACVGHPEPGYGHLLHEVWSAGGEYQRGAEGFGPFGSRPTGKQSGNG